MNTFRCSFDLTWGNNREWSSRKNLQWWPRVQIS